MIYVVCTKLQRTTVVKHFRWCRKTAADTVGLCTRGFRCTYITRLVFSDNGYYSLCIMFNLQQIRPLRQYTGERIRRRTVITRSKRSDTIHTDSCPRPWRAAEMKTHNVSPGTGFFPFRAAEAVVRCSVHNNITHYYYYYYTIHRNNIPRDVYA